tara:strand:+ start:10296 stop:11654 length:1359 start_codon:yes stop_codon:yes gene_type:complete
VNIPKIAYLFGLYFILGLLFIFFAANGAKGDEGIYILSGLQLLDGLPDTFSSWHNGSPYLWSLLAGFTYKVSSLEGVRILTLLLSITILILNYFHCSSHVGKENAWWSSLFLSLSGPFFFFSHIAVYDVLGLVFFMSSALFIQKKNLAHIALAGIFAGLAIITKYAFIIYFPILFLLLYIVTEHRVFLKSLIFLLFSVIIPIFHNLIVFKSLFPDSYASYQATELGFNSLYSLGVSLFILLPIILVFLVPSARNQVRKSKISYLFAGSLLIWPVFHILTGNPTSAEKHIVYAVVFATPLVALPFKHLLTTHATKTISVALFLFFAQAFILESSWSNLAPASDFLQKKITASDNILSNAGTYRFKYQLYDSLNVVDSQVIDFSHLASLQQIDLDTYDYIVWHQTNDKELQTFLANNDSSFVEVFQYTDTFIGADDYLPYGLHVISTTVFGKIR